jgi:hypothetical protein
MFKAIASTFLICIVLVGSAGISLVEQLFSVESQQTCCVKEEASCCSTPAETKDCCADVTVSLHVKFDFAQNSKGINFAPAIFDLVQTKVRWNNQFDKIKGDKCDAVYHVYPPPLFKTGTQLLKEHQEFLI